MLVIFFFSSRRRHTRCSRDWSSDVCSSDLMAPLKVQIAVWLVGALAEETWRVTAIAALVTSRNSPLFSVVAVSVAFGSGCLSLGLQRAAVASLEGVFFGFLFLWQGAFPAPLSAPLPGHGVARGHLPN